MSIVLDVILIAVFAAYVIFAAKKGFVRSLLELVAAVVSLFLAFQLSPVFAQGVYDSFVEESIVETLSEQIDENFDTMSVAEQTNAVIDAMPEFAVSLASSAGVDIDSIKAQITGEKFDSSNIAQSLVDNIAEPIVIGALTIVLFILLATLLLFGLKIVAMLISKLFENSVVGAMNTGLGAALGALKGAIVLVFVCTILRLVFSGGEGEFSLAVNESFVVGLLDYVNPFVESLKELIAKGV